MEKKGSSMSDEREKEQKMEEKSVHGGIKGSACVSLCCTKQSQAEHLSVFSVYLEKTEWGRKKEGEAWRSAGRREREREACGGLKYSSRPRRSEPSKIANQKKTRI